MTKRKYPRTEYIVTGTGNIRPVTLVKPMYEHSSTSWDDTADRKSYHTDALHPTRKAAIAAGRAAVAIAEARLIVSRKNLDKKIANLNKADPA